MDLELTQEQLMFRDMAKEFAMREVQPTARERDREEKFFPDIMKKMGDQGLFGIKVPRELGGLDLDWMTVGLVVEQLSYYDFCVGINCLIGTTLQIMPILTGGNDAQKKNYIAQLVSGKKCAAFAAVEPNAGSDAVAVETTAILKDEEWILNGNKTWITNATQGDWAIVLCQTDKSKGVKGMACFIVERDTPGFSSTKIGHKMGFRSSDTGQLFFRDCRIPNANLLGDTGRGLQLALTCIEHTRFGISFATLGVMEACIDSCVKYCQERNQFNKPIGSFQLMQSQIADMVVDCEASKCLAYQAAYLKDNGLKYSRETSIAKLHNSEKAAKISRTAVEMHGAYGITDDFPVERYYRDMLSPLIFGGTSNIQRLIIGRNMLGIEAISR